jgi:hypothetical protein
MSILPQLEQDLIDAAHRRAPGARQPEAASVPRLERRRRPRRLRLALLALLGVLATTTIALAATGTILTGAPVRPEGQLNPNVGEGVPRPGSAVLLSLRAADPEGGLPWGMRLVRTTRGLLCVQIGRVENGQLGELGIDGVFHDDGRFHPLPTDVLPETSRVGVKVANEDATESVSCALASQVFDGQHLGVDRSGGASTGRSVPRPESELRDLYYGVLGPAAVSVSYRTRAAHGTVPTVSPSGAYLIVGRVTPADQAGYGSEGLGTAGDLQPSRPLTAITYRLSGVLCERGPVLAPWERSHLARPCPRPHYPGTHGVPLRNLHLTLHTTLRRTGDTVTGVDVSFAAPFAVSEAGQDYTLMVPSDCPGTGGRGGGLQTLGRNVARGAAVTEHFSAQALFYVYCSPVSVTAGRGAGGLVGGLRPTRRSTARIEVIYTRGPQQATLVGVATVTLPPGTRVQAPAPILRRGSRGPGS